ncbi:hypothetical protein J2S43_000631 [Catenuloplanes nepalensis]|uniref:Uncharacterized protein n=1 Tax=Catenuloplanes nepalensis TaxID=587533 RepID=A0ABT9ML14_9ACTN|nr:hypothetical protein [Catenuloplanes nepalensis]MDP9792119.1 hypothetical protein [Catenuloplanes nepalensis]
MSTLTSAAFADDPFEIRNWPDFALYLSLIHQATGMSLSDLEAAESGLDDRRLDRGAVSDALIGRRPIRKALLESLLRAWSLPDVQRGQVREVWRRLDARAGAGPANAGRCRDASPHALGLHASIRVGDSADDLPAYVRRDFDDHLREIIAKGADEGAFVLLVGGSSTGKTRSLYEAILNVVPDWWLLHPADTRDVIRAHREPTERTVLWLDELQNFLGADPPLNRAILDGLMRAGMIVVGTIWSEHYMARSPLRHPDGFDKYADDRQLLKLATRIRVDAEFTAREREEAAVLAKRDERLRVALATGAGAGLPRALVGASALLESWEHASSPFVRAVITAAADARRLGVGSPLPEELLRDAIEGYLSPADRAVPPERWLAGALPYLTDELGGGTAVLAPYARKAGSLDGYVIADFLAQHISGVNRTACPPDSLWEALLAHVTNPDDLRRLSVSAQARMRYRYAEAALRRLPELNDLATLDLTDLLVRQDRLHEARVLLAQRIAVSPSDDLRDRYDKLVNLMRRADQVRSRPGVTAAVTGLLADFGRADLLRERADAGDVTAAEALVDVLAEQGHLDELRERADRGHRYAAEQLADLLALHGRVAELRSRAESGDEPAGRRYRKMMADGVPGRAEAARQIEELRAQVDGGDERSARTLTALLFDLGVADALLDEVNAGTPGAVDRYLALLTAREETDRETLHHLRAFGINPDGTPAAGTP